MQSINILQGLLLDSEDASVLSAAHLERLYVFSVMWSIGAILELDDRVKLESFMREDVELDLPSFDEGNGNTIFEYFVTDSGMSEIFFTLEMKYIRLISL